VRDHCPLGCHRVFDGLTQDIDRAFFGEIRGCARGLHLLLRIGGLIDRQTDDHDVRPICFDPPRRFNAVHAGHVDVHHHDIWTELLSECHGFDTVARFADHFQMIVGCDDAPHALPQHPVIVHQQNANLRVLLES